jgi:hypothetical protein
VLGGCCWCVLRPHCWQCASPQGGRIRARRVDAELARIADQEQPDERVLEPVGFARDDRAWDVAWLDDLRDVPGNAGDCAASYPDECIPPPPPDLDCGDIPYQNFRVLWNVPDPDPHHFDGNRDGIGCSG